MSGVVIANPFGPVIPPPQPEAPRNPFAAQAAFSAPYGTSLSPPFTGPDPYAAAAAQVFRQPDAGIIEGEFTVPSVQTVLAPQMPVPQPATLGPDAMLTEADLTAEYIKLREDKRVIAERHTEELAPLTDRMADIERTMLARLNSTGVESVRTTMGTAFKKLTTRYSVDDGETFMGWIQANNQQDMLARAVKQDAIREYLDNTGTLPPGIAVFSQWAVQFRK